MSAAVLYHWRLKPGREEEFALAWKDVTRQLHRHCGSKGARLHRASDGSYWSYACWPSEETRQQSSSNAILVDNQSLESLKSCIAEGYPETTLELLSDLLGDKAVHAEMPTLTTERLVLRPMQYSDASALYPALSDEANMRYWSRGPLQSVEQVREYIQWNIEGATVECFALAKSEAPESALGWAILIDRGPGQAELGFILRPDAQGQGLAKEATTEVLRHAFETRELRRVYADVDPENEASIRLLECLGMIREGHLRATWETHIGVRDSYIYGCVAGDRGMSQALLEFG